MLEKQVNRIFKKVDELPSFAQIANDALIAERQKSINGDITSELGFHDPKLAEQILQMTNFTSFGFSGLKAGSFESAQLDGKDLLRGVMLAHSLQQFLTPELKAYDLVESKLWEHSMNCALAAWMMATKVDFEDYEAAFVAGLMHDIGKIILDEFLYEEKEKYVDIIIQESVSPIDAEKAILGIDHAEIGAQVAEKWDFDSNVVEAIRCHHQPELAENEPDLTTIVHLSDCICMDLGMALNSDAASHLQLILQNQDLGNAG